MPDLPSISKPVVTSQLSAERSLQGWLATNDYHDLKDLNGHPWALRVRTTELPTVGDKAGLRFEVHLSIETFVDAGSLVSTAVLDVAKDERLLELLGESQVKLTMRPKTTVVSTREDAKSWLADTIANLRGQMQSESMPGIKRHLLGTWIDQHRSFGSSWPGRG